MCLSAVQVLNRCRHASRVFLKKADAAIAAVTQNSPDLAGLVVVIYVQSPVSLLRAMPAADIAGFLLAVLNGPLFTDPVLTGGVLDSLPFSTLRQILRVSRLLLPNAFLTLTAPVLGVEDLAAMLTNPFQKRGIPPMQIVHGGDIGASSDETLARHYGLAPL